MSASGSPYDELIAALLARLRKIAANNSVVDIGWGNESLTAITGESSPPPWNTTTFSSAISFNETVRDWLCDVNNSELWQMEYPVCTTRYRSIAIFVIVAFVLFFITLCTVLGNGLVLVALYKYKSLRTMSNCLIGNLAVSDLFLATVVMPVSTMNDLLGYWVFGGVACTLWLIIDVLCCTASVWGLCTVAFDRCLATAYPVWYHDQRSVKKALACMVFVWIFSIIISIAPFIGWQNMIPSFFTFNHDINRHECILFMSSSYVIYSSTGSFVIPTCLMTFMYIKIFSVLRKQSNNMKKKAQARKLSRRRAVVNGCPTIRVPETTDVVVRDFTTTTLVSMSAVEVSVFSEDRDLDESTTFEQDELPRVSLHSSNGVPPHNRDGDNLLDECINATRAVDKMTNAGYDLASPNGSTQSGYNLVPNNNLVVPGRAPLPQNQKRSNSLSTASGNVAANSKLSLLSIVDLERRNSHEGAIRPRGPSDGDIGSGDESHSTLLKPVSQRSKSANVLSSDEEGSINSAHSSHQARRSLPCDLATLRRNNKMTLSMKRRFELREQRATKRMLLIMACFCVCWMPFVAMYITRSLCHECHMNTHLVAAIIWLGYVNSSLNPVLYSLFNDDFKNAFKKVLGIKTSRTTKRRR